MELRVEREVVFPADPGEVWEALTEPDRLEEWFATEAELDPVPGGEGVFRWGDGDERRAIVREAEPEERLVLDWDDGGEVVLELDRDTAAVVPVEDEPLRLLQLSDDCVSLVAVAPPEDALATGTRVELDLLRKPLLEPVGIDQRLPDLVGLLRYDDLSYDFHLRNLLVAY